MIAYTPVKTPVLSLLRSNLCNSFLDDDSSMYLTISVLLLDIFLVNSCSGDKTKYVTPKIVSGLVVKTSILSSKPSISKLIEAPTLFPIQFF